MGLPSFPGDVWLVDFEFHPAHGREGNPPVPVCMVACEITSGRTLRLWQDELARLAAAPFPTDASALFVAYYAPAEMSCFIALGWPVPANVLDLFIAFRRHTNGKRIPAGNGLLGALAYYGLDALAADEKDAMRDLVLRGGPWDAAEQRAILDYCESDVLALAKLLPAMQGDIDWPRAALQGRYAVAVAQIEANGVPIDTDALAALKNGWQGIQHRLIAAVDAGFGVYEGTTFKLERFERYLAAQRIAWPRLLSGGLDLQDDTFKDMARMHPQLSPLRELRGALSQMRLSDLAVGDDGRNRCMLSMFFNNISDVSVIIGTEVDKQGYWQAVQSLHNEYDAWHVLGDALPPPAFIAAAREVATVLHDDKGLIADPVDLITLQITANIDGDGTKVANNEAALVRMSSNGLSYLILCVVMIGFINSIRGKEKIVIPFVVDELKDLSVGNATALLNLLAQNNINIVSAFPDVDPDLAPLFNKNYKILPGRMLATVKLESEDAYV